MDPESNKNSNTEQGEAPNQMGAEAAAREAALKAKLAEINTQDAAKAPQKTPLADTPAQQTPPTPKPAPAPARPKMSPNTSTAKPTKSSSKAIGILVTLLLLGLIAVAGVFAAKLTLGPSDGPESALVAATEHIMNQEVHAYRTTLSTDFKTSPDDLGATVGDLPIQNEYLNNLPDSNRSLNGNVTLVADTILKKGSLQSRGNVYLSINESDLNMSLAFINKDNDLYLSLDSFEYDTSPNSPRELAALSFFSFDDITQKWIYLTDADVAESFTDPFSDEEPKNQTELTNEYFDSLQSIKLVKNWQTVLAKHIENVDTLSTDTQYAYSMNFTNENLIETLNVFGLEHLVADMTPEDITYALEYINNQVFYISKDTNTLTSITLSDSTHINQTGSLELTANLTVTPIEDQDFEAPTTYISFEELFAQMFGF